MHLLSFEHFKFLSPSNFPNFVARQVSHLSVSRTENTWKSLSNAHILHGDKICMKIVIQNYLGGGPADRQGHFLRSKYKWGILRPKRQKAVSGYWARRPCKSGNPGWLELASET
jgi:hypothetical protein